MRQCLPLNVKLQLLEDTNWLGSLRACLTSVLEEAKEECRETEDMMRGRELEVRESSPRENKVLAKLRDKTDWTMSIATR